MRAEEGGCQREQLPRRGTLRTNQPMKRLKPGWWMLAAALALLCVLGAYGIYFVSAAHGHGLAGDDPLAIVGLIICGVVFGAMGGSSRGAGEGKGFCWPGWRVPCCPRAEPLASIPSRA